MQKCRFHNLEVSYPLIKDHFYSGWTTCLSSSLQTFASLGVLGGEISKDPRIHYVALKDKL